MIIGFDIGNTNTLMGFFAEDSEKPFYTCSYKTRKKISGEKLSSQIGDNVEFMRNKIKNKEAVTGFVFSSVAPEINSAYHDSAIILYNINAVEINHKSRLSFSIRYNDPATLGVDRIVNAEAAYREYPGNSIIVDLGTAATFCIVLEEGTFDGGIIAPGIGTTIQALAKRASNLPEIVFEKPENIVARDTVNAIKSGFFYGWLSLVEGIIQRMKSHYDRDFQVILTGGASKVIADNISIPAIYDPMLTMKGLKYLFDLNS